MSTTFSVSRDDIIAAALRKQGYLAKGQNPTPEDYADMSFALNIIIKSWVKGGIPLWKIVDISFPATVNLATYSIGPNLASNPNAGIITADKPLRILNAFTRDLSVTPNVDTPILVMSVDDYARYSTKLVAGSRTNQLLFLPGVTATQVTMYPPTSVSNMEYHLMCQVPLGDVNVGTDVVDFPSECYQALLWNLADETAEDNNVPADKIGRISQKARIYKMEMEAWSQEEASLYFSLDRSGR